MIFELEHRLKHKKCWELDWLYKHYTQLAVGLPVKKLALTSKWWPFWKFQNILDRFILTSVHQLWKDLQNSFQKKYFKCWWLYWWHHSVTSKFTFYTHLNEIVTFSAIQVAVCNQSLLNLVHICSFVLHIGLQMLLVKGQITRSWDQKVGQILKLP